MVTDFKKCQRCQAQELTAENASRLIPAKKILSVPLAGWTLFSSQMKNFHGYSPTSQQSKWLRVRSRDYHVIGLM